MKLYYAVGACSIASHIILNEINAKYSIESVDLQTKKTESGKDFLEINPNGYVPALELDNGEVLFENFAVLNYLSDLQPAKNLSMQESNGLDIYHVYSWLSFLSTEVHKNLYPLIIHTGSKEWAGFANGVLKKRFAYINQHLQDKEFLVGDHFTVADAYLFVNLLWVKKYLTDVDLSTEWPNLAAALERTLERDSVKKALKTEGWEV